MNSVQNLIILLYRTTEANYTKFNVLIICYLMVQGLHWNTASRQKIILQFV